MSDLITTQLTSSDIKSITYDPEDGMLEVVYRRTGHIYDHFGVPPDVHAALVQSTSKTRFLNEVIKPKYDYARAEFPLG